MPITYPPAGPSLSGDLLSISRFLNNPTYVARALRTLSQQRYVADALLTGRYQVNGGAILYETGESIYTADSPRAVAPGSEYPLTTAGTGQASIAATVNWGEDVAVTDVAIKRLQLDPVRRAFIKLVNQNVKFVDSVAMAAVTSAVTNTAAAAASWATATAAQILADVGQAKAQILALNMGYDPDTVVVDDVRWMRAMTAFVAAGYVPRESLDQNPALNGDFPTILGMRWLRTPNGISGTALVADSQLLGGMADEDLGGPGYVSANEEGPMVQAKTIRDDERDQWRLRARRVTVPVVVEPAAARTITGL